MITLKVKVLTPSKRTSVDTQCPACAHWIIIDILCSPVGTIAGKKECIHCGATLAYEYKNEEEDATCSSKG